MPHQSLFPSPVHPSEAEKLVPRLVETLDPGSILSTEDVLPVREIVPELNDQLSAQDRAKPASMGFVCRMASVAASAAASRLCTLRVSRRLLDAEARLAALEAIVKAGAAC